ncbi:MAG: hypothetical protein IT370_24715 [Deltaproteobacteria bacterium]|nr:hypothetical protein [Deltaproteobacteria bacterium]
MTVAEALAGPGTKVQIAGKELRNDGRALLIYSVGSDGARQLAHTRLPEAAHQAMVADLTARGLRVAQTDFKSGVIWVSDAQGVEVHDGSRRWFAATGDRATLADGRVVARSDLARVFAYAEGYADRGVKGTLTSGDEVDLAYEYSISAAEDPTYNRNLLLSDTTWCAAVGIAIAHWAGVRFENRI